MALREYKRKRDFEKTPEPPPERRLADQGFSYLIQKHAATRLHYDLRLELDGVLLSWAVTKGPSLNPSDKRLAVHVEDHPLSYGTFEGTIPKGQYGGGTVMLWDRGTWEPRFDPHAGMKKGHFAFTLHGERLKGDWDLVRMRTEEKRENWLFIKQKDEEAREAEAAAQFLEDENTSVTTGRSMDEIAMGVPAAKTTKRSQKDKTLDRLVKEYPNVELATLVQTPPEGNKWLHEIKFDGYRLLVFLANGVVQLQTRNKNNWTHKFPTIHASVAKLKAKTGVLDMEAVVTDNNGKTSFQALQQALGDGGKSQLVRAFVFDLLHLDGKDLRREPLTKRKASLKKLLEKSQDANSLHYSDHVVGQGSQMADQSCAMGLEGIVSKRVESTYQAGRQTSWLKFKCIKRQEFVIIGYTTARTGSRAIGALHLGHYDGSNLKYAGKVGTGFSMEDAQKLFNRLQEIEIDDPPVEKVPTSLLKAAHWVKPSLLCEVSFTEWTEDGHIRHPSFQGLREDKSADDVKKENPVKIRNSPHSATNQGKSLTVVGITISHPDRVIFMDTGITKGELAKYYAVVAPWILKDIANHPVTLLRCPEGISGECFYQRNAGKGLGADVKPFPWKHKGKFYEYIFIRDEKGLLQLIQMGSIELHPWGSRVDRIEFPDRLIFDLDPDESVPFEAVKLAAEDLRRRLKAKGLESFLKCTGGKGLHITAPIAARYPWARVKEFCASQAAEMVRDVSSAYVATMTKAKRKGKIFVDYFRNDHTATAIADYSVRARAGAPVAVPLEWSELKTLRAANQFSIADVVKRLERKKLKARRYDLAQKLPS
jgi:bifunctional non-homologous end joining protein LigD